MYRRRAMGSTSLRSAATRVLTSRFSNSWSRGVKMQVEVTSVESIKPSSATTYGLEPFKLSLLDQLEYSTSSPLIFFYPKSKSKNITSVLKDSLSNTLNSFYPLSGRISDEDRDMMFIRDYDRGVPFVEARAVGERLRDFLQPPRLEHLNHLVPCREPLCIVPADGPQVAAQLTTFDCGGVALGLSFHHRICDAATISLFLRTWAASANPVARVVCKPDLTGASSVFPPRESLVKIVPSSSSSSSPIVRRSNPRRFVFDSDAVSALKSMARSRRVENPSRTEALSAFIWKSAMQASSRTSRPAITRFVQMASLRSRVGHPRLSDNTIGNLTTSAFATCEETSTVQELAAALHKAVEGIDHKYLDDSSWIEEMFVDMTGVVDVGSPSCQQHDFLVCSSVLRIQFRDELDFGFGKPIWTGMFGNARGDHHVFYPSHTSFILLKEVGAGNGIEAWMTLDEDLMAALENHPDFLNFASPNPPILFDP